MTETIILKLTPKLEVILNETDFEIIDKDEIKNEGIYSYHNTLSVEYKKEKVNWLVTIVSSIFGLLSESDLGSRYKDKPYLMIVLNGKTLKLCLLDADLENVAILMTRLNKKLNSSLPTS